jgi:hypothetical protein
MSWGRLKIANNFELRSKNLEPTHTYDRIMGYSTDFYGFWTLTPALSLAQTDYLQKFSRTRRVKRNPDAIKTDRRLAAIGLDLGVDAEYFVDIEDEDKSIVDLNLIDAGFPIKNGHIEIFPNTKPYSPNKTKPTY